MAKSQSINKNAKEDDLKVDTATNQSGGTSLAEKMRIRFA